MGKENIQQDHSQEEEATRRREWLQRADDFGLIDGQLLVSNVILQAPSGFPVSLVRSYIGPFFVLVSIRSSLLYRFCILKRFLSLHHLPSFCLYISIIERASSVSEGAA